MSKLFSIRHAAVLAAAALSVVSLTACGSGKPVKSNLPEISQTVDHADTPEQHTSATEEQTSVIDTNPDGELVTEGNTAYYYINGVVQKGGIVGNTQNGFYYANEEGAIDLGYCDGVEFNGAQWNVIEGKATEVFDESDEVLYRALQAVAKFTTTDMTREEKLRACFDHLKTDYLEGVRHDPPYQEIDWPILYANDIFVYGKGDCFSYGAAFAYIGKAIGFTECYACNSGGHGWAQIDGKYYDPEWDMHHNEYNHFGVTAEDDCDVDYVDSLTEGVDWMRVKV